MSPLMPSSNAIRSVVIRLNASHVPPVYVLITIRRKRTLNAIYSTNMIETKETDIIPDSRYNSNSNFIYYIKLKLIPFILEKKIYIYTYKS